MENLGKDFENLVKKTKKRRRWLRVLLTVVVSVIATGVVIIGAVTWRNNYVNQQYNEAVNKMQIFNEIASPNLSSSPSFSPLTGLLGGTITENTFKNVDGYPVSWSDQSWDYGQGGVRNYFIMPYVQDTNWSPTFSFGLDSKTPVSFNGDVSKKNAYFYKADSSTIQTNEAGTLKKLTNHLAEVYVTFDKPYSYAEIQKMVPSNLLINWYWIGDDYDNSGAYEPFIGLSGNMDYYSNDSYGNGQTGRNSMLYRANAAFGLDNTMYSDFVAAVKDVTNPAFRNRDTGFIIVDHILNAAKWVEKYPTLDSAKFAGVILTGRTENFAAIEKEPWARVTSVGAVTEILPYITPIK